MAEKLYKILREKQLPEFVGIRRTTIYELIKAGQFPKPIPLNDSGRAKGWLEAEVAAWQAQRIARRQRSGGGEQ